MSTKYGILLNIDIDTVVRPFLDDVAAKETPLSEDLWPFVDQYADTAITDILFDIFCQYSAVDSTVFSDYAYKFQQKVENGIPVDYAKEYGSLYRLNRDWGLDPYAVWIARARERGMRPWISVRMNDCHCPELEAGFLRSDFFYEAREKGWMIGERYGYYRHCFDYAFPQVREKMLAYIREQLGRYDVHGLELDFMREIFCFDVPNCHDRCEIMNGFIREVKRLVDEAAQVWGHPIELGVRLSRDIGQSKLWGFDAAAWAREGLVDLIVPTPRWETGDDDMPIAAWKAALPDVAVVAGLEIIVNRLSTAITAEVARALAGKYLTQGSDGVYAFNLFIGHWNDGRISDEFREIYRTCGSLDEILRHPARYVVQWQDIVPEGCVPYKPLPMTLDGAWQELTLDLGVQPEGICTLTLGVEGEVEVMVNGAPVTLADAGVAGETGFCQPGAQLLQGDIPRAGDARYTLSLRAAGEKATVVYAEMYTQP